MKKKYFKIAALSLLGLYTVSTNTFAEKKQLLVITSLPSLEKLSKSQIRQIYLQGGINVQVKPLTFSSGNKNRSIFNTKIIGLTESRIESYWAQMKFTGRATPPQEFATTEELLTFLIHNSGYIAYVPANTEIPNSLNVVLTLNY